MSTVLREGREVFTGDGQRGIDTVVRAAFDGLDFEQTRARYLEQSELVYLPGLLPASAVAQMVSEFEQLRPQVHWARTPFMRKAGAVGFSAIQQHAPTMRDLYASPAFMDWVSRLAGRPVFLKSEDDEHACALYVYSRPGDHVRAHYDSCGCEEFASYTVLIGLIDRSTSWLYCQMHREDPSRRRTLAVTTSPGSAVIFCGDKIYHWVTPLGRNEERVVLSFSYAANPVVARRRGLFENIKDAALYFGPAALWQRHGGRRMAGPQR